MKKKWRVEVEQNGIKGMRWFPFYAEKLRRIGQRTLVVDGYVVEFDENIVGFGLADEGES